MKGKTKRADGGVARPKPYNAPDSGVVHEAEERKKGGRVKKPADCKVDGKMSRMRLDRPGRKMGGRVGADKSPLSSAAGGEEPSDQTEHD